MVARGTYLQTSVLDMMTDIERFADVMYGGTRLARIPTLAIGLRRLLEIQEDDLVYDVGCGRGYVSVQLAMHGARVLAVDSSRAFTDDLQTGAKALHLPILVVCADASIYHPNLHPKYIFILWNTLGAVDREVDRSILSNARSVAAEGTRIVVEISTTENIAGQHDRVLTRALDDSSLLVRSRSFNPHTGILSAHWKIMKSNIVKDRWIFQQRPYSRSDFIRLLAESGWSANQVVHSTATNELPFTGSLFVAEAG